MALRDWLPGCEPDNGLTAKQEREAHRQYDETVKRLRAQGPEGKREADKFVNEQQALYSEWRRNAKRQ